MDGITASELQAVLGEVLDGADYPVTTYYVAMDTVEGRQKIFGQPVGPARSTLLEAKADLEPYRRYLPDAYVKAVIRFF